MASDHRDPLRGAPGKLKAAARRWAESRLGGSDELAEDMEAFGLSDQIKARDTGPFGVWPENVNTVSAFMELECHWVTGQRADGSAFMVLDHAQIKYTLELMCVKRRHWTDIFNGLKAMEAEVIKTVRGET